VNVPTNQQIFLAASTTYWLVFESTSAQSSNNTWNIVRQTTSSYANGTDASKLDAAAWSAGTGDLDIAVTTAAITSNDKLAQGFQLTEAVSVLSVKLWLKKVASPTGNLTVKIQTNSGGSPSGTPVTNGTSNTVAASSLSTSYGYITFTFSTPPSLSASTQYHIVLETADSQSNTNYVVWGADGSSPGYASGEMKRERAAAWSAESKDAVFQVVSSDIQYVNEVNVDWWSSTKADMVNQFGDTSGVDIDTKTTFKCKAAAGFADLTVEVVL